MELKIAEQSHPNSSAEANYNKLVGIDEQKEELLNSLYLLFDKSNVSAWHKKHHQSKLTFLSKITDGLPVFILSGDVGCGKTALANSIASPLAKKLGKRVICFETPSNIRGAGRVGEISNRITEAFSQVKGKLGKTDLGVLILDEADDIATSRDQNQAHHEDRAGLNVLIKQIDLITREEVNLAVILITNRLSVIDPAIIRRATQVIKFERPDSKAKEQVFASLFEGMTIDKKGMEKLLAATELHKIPYSYSDLIQKVGKQAIYKAIREDKPFNEDIYIEVLKKVEPSPLI